MVLSGFGSGNLVALFVTRAVRMFGFGALPVVLSAHLLGRGFNMAQIGVLLSLTLLGDAIVSIGVTRLGDRVGRKRVLIWSSGLMALAGLGVVFFSQPALLLLCAIVGTLSPNGGEVGPFSALEQSALAQLHAGKKRLEVFGWYQLVGSVGAALGAFWAGWWATTPAAQTQVLLTYAACAVVLALVFSRLDGRIEASAPTQNVPDPKQVLQSTPNIWRLTMLFAVDSLGSAMVMQSLLAVWLEQRFAATPATLGAVFGASQLIAALSGPVAAWLATRIGLVNTMVYTHIPANVFLMALPLAPNLQSAVLLILARFSLSQMDVPARTALMMGLVPDHKRAGAAGLTQQGKLVGTALGPAVGAWLLARGWMHAPFVVGGALKIAYDVAVYVFFSKLERGFDKSNNP